MQESDGHKCLKVETYIMKQRLENVIHNPMISLLDL